MFDREFVHDGLHLVALGPCRRTGQHRREKLGFLLGVVLEHGMAEEAQRIGRHLPRLRRRCQQGGQSVQRLQVAEDARVAVRESSIGECPEAMACPCAAAARPPCRAS